MRRSTVDYATNQSSLMRCLLAVVYFYYLQSLA